MTCPHCQGSGEMFSQLDGDAYIPCTFCPKGAERQAAIDIEVARIHALDARCMMMESLLREAYDKGYLKDKVTYDENGLEDRVGAALHPVPVPRGPIDIPRPGERWRHWKGDVVTVLRAVLHCDTKEPYVVYRHPTPAGDEWIRSLADWHDNTDPRFAPRSRFERA